MKNLQEMSLQEMKQVEGGFAFLLGVFIGIMLALILDEGSKLA